MLFLKVNFFHKDLINQNLLFLYYYYGPIIYFQALNLDALSRVNGYTQVLILFTENIKMLNFHPKIYALLFNQITIHFMHIP